MKRILLGLAAILMLFASCNKCHDSDGVLVGEWGRTQIYGNQSWGGEYQWRNGEDGTGVIFRSNGEFWRNEAKVGSMLIGNYSVSSDNTVTIKEIGTGNIIETFRYSLDHRNLDLNYNRTEGTIIERFQTR